MQTVVDSFIELYILVIRRQSCLRASYSLDIPMGEETSPRVFGPTSVLPRVQLCSSMMPTQALPFFNHFPASSHKSYPTLYQIDATDFLGH